MYNKFINTRKFTTFIIAAGLLLSISSCKKDNTTDTTTISDDEVAEAVTESVSGSSGGLATQTETSAAMISTTSLSCGASGDTSIAGQNLPNAAITYNYNLVFNSSVSCNAGIPNQFDFDFTGQSSYTALHMSSSDKSTAHFTISGLQPAASSYVFNQSYVRNGTQQSSIRNKHSFSSTITITSANITVDKTTQKIISGTAEVQFSGSVSTGTTVSRGCIITFLGGNKATLALNNGSSYNIMW